MYKKPQPPDFAWDTYLFPGTQIEVSSIKITDELKQWAASWLPDVDELIQDLRATRRAEKEIFLLHRYLKLRLLLASLADGRPGTSEHDYIQAREWSGIRHLVVTARVHSSTRKRQLQEDDSDDNEATT